MRVTGWSGGRKTTWGTVLRRRSLAKFGLEAGFGLLSGVGLAAVARVGLNDAVVEQRSVDAVVSQLSLGLGSAVQGLASSMQDHLRSLPPHTSRQAQPTSGNYP